MRFSHVLFAPTLAAALAGCAFAQDSTKPAQPADIPDAPQATAAAMIHPNGPSVVMDTSMGRITCQFYQKQAPKTVANFINLAQGTRDWTDPATKKVMHHKPLFDGTIFHRVIPDFMIQGGDPLGTGRGGPGYKFADEIHPDLRFDRPYLLAMANAGPGTNGSQFFITVTPTTWLNGKHTIFGDVVTGQDVVEAIVSTPTKPGDRPVTDVVLQSVTISRG